MLGIVNLKLATMALAEVANLGAGIAANGANYAKDVVYIPQFLKVAKDIGAVKYSQLLPEAEDVDESERQDLADFFAANLNIQSTTVMEIIKEGFTILSWGLEAIQLIEAVIERVKPAAAA